MNFIYALNEEVRENLIKQGFKELFYCYVNGDKAYAFENIPNKLYAIYGDTDMKNMLVTDMAYFI
jgi:hypothetical protein